MKIGIVGTSGGWSSEFLTESVSKMTGSQLLIEMKKVSLDLDSGKAYYNGVDLTTLDALIIKKVGARYSPDMIDRLEVLRFLNENGLPMFSKPLHIMRVLDRLSCTVTLRAGGIPMPETRITEDAEEALSAVQEFGAAVFKPLYTSKARGMLLLEDGPDALEKILSYKSKNSVMYIQKKIDLPEKDLGVVFLGGEYLTTYGRCKNENAWNTTTNSGGKYVAYTPSAEIIDLAYKAQALFGLDFTCVDVAETNEGPIVFEVSAFGGFKGITSTSDINPARLYIDYVMNKVNK